MKVFFCENALFNLLLIDKLKCQKKNKWQLPATGEHCTEDFLYILFILTFLQIMYVRST